MQRIVIIGNGGGGKSVLARRLAERLRLPHVELDKILWRPGWQLTPEPEYRAEHQWIIADDRWIIDGLGRRDSIPARLARATDIVLIDLPLWTHFWLAAERQIDWAAGRIEHPPAGLETAPPTRALFETIWEVDRNWLPQVRELAEIEATRGKSLFRLTSLEELDGFATGF